jgi:hypothetical protein
MVAALARRTGARGRPGSFLFLVVLIRIRIRGGNRRGGGSVGRLPWHLIALVSRGGNTLCVGGLCGFGQVVGGRLGGRW